MSQEFWSSLFPESVVADPMAELPAFVESTPPDFFEEDFEGAELDNLDEDVCLLALSDAPQTLPAYRDISTPSSLTSSSGSLDSTDLTEDNTNSEYSIMTHATSSYQPPLAFRDVDYNSQSVGVDPKHTSAMFADPAILADADTAGFLDSLRTLEFPSNIFETVQVFKAQSDDGPYRRSVSVAPHSLFTASQGASMAFPMDTPVGAALAAQTNTGPVRKRFICPECGHLSARKHNLKTHMETHNPNRPKPFVCPEVDCAHPFTRKHDLKRHLESMHGDRAK